MTELTMKERWKRLHRTRRMFKKAMEKHWRELVANGTATIQANPGDPIVAGIVEMQINMAATKMCNPPIVVDEKIMPYEGYRVVHS